MLSMDFPFNGGIGKAVCGGFDITGAFELLTRSLLLHAQMSVRTRAAIVSETERIDRRLLIDISVCVVTRLGFFHMFFWQRFTRNTIFTFYPTSQIDELATF